MNSAPGKSMASRTATGLRLSWSSCREVGLVLTFKVWVLRRLEAFMQQGSLTGRALPWLISPSLFQGLHGFLDRGAIVPRSLQDGYGLRKRAKAFKDQTRKHPWPVQLSFSAYAQSQKCGNQNRIATNGASTTCKSFKKASETVSTRAGTGRAHASDVL